MALKTAYIHSNKLRQSARGQECTLETPSVCNYNNDTTVLAHINSERKGLGIKSDDIHAVYACSDCHATFDGGTLSREEYYFYALRALQRTQLHMVGRGLLKVA